jgi:hypothetical protein
MFTIYAMRAKGDIEVRYVGQTAKTPESRIYSEAGQARWRQTHGSMRDDRFGEWLLGNQVEAVTLATAATKAEACAKEREMVEAFARLGHRLFNRWLVPAELRRAA